MSIEVKIKTQAVEAVFRKLKSPEHKKRALEAIGRSILTKVRMGFRASTDPWGEAWKPLFLRKGKPLEDTGALRNSFSYRVESDSVKVGTSLQVGYKGKTHNLARIHQFGRTIKPLPENKKGLLRVPLGKSGKKGKAYTYFRSTVIDPRPMLPIRRNGQADFPASWSDSALQAMAKSFGLSIK